MQSIPILPYKFNTSQNVMLPYSKLRSNIDTIQNSAIIDIQNAIRNKIAKAKVKNIIENKNIQYQNARNATIKNMQNTIMAQGVINDLIDAAANQSNKKIKTQAATKIQNAFKKLKTKNDKKKDLIKKLTKERIRRFDAIQALNERLNLEQEALKRYSNDNPKKFAKMEIQIQKTIKQIQMYKNQINFLTEKIEKI
jgi:hypothetical protein